MKIEPNQLDHAPPGPPFHAEVFIQCRGKVIPLPELMPGQFGTATDYRDNSFLVFCVNKKTPTGQVWRSASRHAIEAGKFRVVGKSQEDILLTEFDAYTPAAVPFICKYGLAELYLYIAHTSFPHLH